MVNNEIIKGLEMAMKGIAELKPKEIDAEMQLKVDEAIKKGTDGIAELKEKLANLKNDINI